MSETWEYDSTTEQRAIDVFRRLNISLKVISSQKINNYKRLNEGPLWSKDTTDVLSSLLILECSIIYNKTVGN